MEKDRALAHLLKQHPVRLAHMLGYDLLREGLHDRWIRDIAYGKHDMTLQAHRGSYKTTSLEVALWVIMLTQPDKTVDFSARVKLMCQRSSQQLKRCCVLM